MDGRSDSEFAQKDIKFTSDLQERLDQLALTEFNPKNKNVYRGLFPLIEGKLSHKVKFFLEFS